MQQDILAAMHYYASLGLPIIPVCSHNHAHTTVKHNERCNCAGKVPLISGWQTRTETTPEHIKEWVRQFKSMNVGLPLGSASGYCGIDVDGEEGEKILFELSDGDLPATWEFLTASGRRLLYRIPAGIETKKFKKDGEGEHQECAFLCSGQQTVLPPSIHESEYVYEWIEGRDPQNMDCTDAPQWLVKLIRKDDKYPTLNLTNIKQQIVHEGLGSPVDEFDTSEEFSDYVPEDLQNIKSATVKTQGAKQGEATPTESLLYQVISEGSRDTTMTKIIGHFLSKPEYRSLPKEMFLTLMMDYNERYCDPPLEPDAINAKVAHFMELESQKSAMYKDSSDKKKKEFHASKLAHTIMQQLRDNEELLIDYELKSGTFYTCHPKHGPWKARSGNYLQSIRALARKYVKSERFGDPSWDKDHYISEVLSAIKDIMLEAHAKEEKSFDLHSNQENLKRFMAVDGQLLDWRSGTLHTWDPSYKYTINYEVGYDPDADCPHWEKYMKDWIPDEGSRNLMQEFLGYCLIPDTKLEAFVILTGSGSNGKSMMLNFIKSIFGEACSTMGTSKMVERFGKATLNGKLVNICTEDEGEGGYLRHTDEIKALVSGEEIIAEYKGKDPFKFRNIARFIFATNNIPKSKDRSHGWYRRQIIIHFPNRFAKDMNKAREMEYNMSMEKAGIFNWMLAGLRRVMVRGDLVIPESVFKNHEEFKAINDPLEGFLRECTKPMPTEERERWAKAGLGVKRIGVATGVLYRIYEFWCEDNYGEKARQLKMVQRNFTERINKEKGIEKSRGWCIIRGDNKQQCFLGITIDIVNLDFAERLMEDFKGYSPLEPEAFIRKFVQEYCQDKECAITAGENKKIKTS